MCNELFKIVNKFLIEDPNYRPNSINTCSLAVPRALSGSFLRDIALCASAFNAFYAFFKLAFELF